MSETLFIAYAVEDRAYVADLAARIEASTSLRAWYFERDEQYGAHYREEIIKQIDGCRAVLVIVSPTSAFSRSVEREIDQAIQLNKPIIPIVIGDIRRRRIDADMTRGPVMFELRPRHLIDARAGQDPLPEVLRRLGLSAARAPEPLAPPSPPPARPQARPTVRLVEPPPSRAERLRPLLLPLGLTLAVGLLWVVSLLLHDQLLRDRPQAGVFMLSPALIASALVSLLWAGVGTRRLAGRWRQGLLLATGGVCLAGFGLITWQAVNPPRFTPESFGVAVAQFGEGDTFAQTERSREVSNQIHSSIAQIVHTRENHQLKVLPIGPINSAEAARRQGERMGAALVIWGEVTPLGAGRAYVNFTLINTIDAFVADGLAQNPPFPVILPASTAIQFPYAQSVALEPDPIRNTASAEVRAVANFSLGLSAYGRRDYLLAVRMFERADAALTAPAEGDPDARKRAGLVKFYLGRTLQQVGQLQEGARLLAAAQVLLPDDPAIPLSLALGARSQGDMVEMRSFAERAAERADRWLEREPDARMVRYHRAMAAMLLDDPLRAAADFKAGIAAHPDFYIGYLGAAGAYREAGELARAAELFTAAVAVADEQRTDAAWALLGLGDVAQARGDLDEAWRYYQQAARTSPALGLIQHRLARIAQARGQLAEARALYDQLAQGAADPAWAYLARAEFLRQIGDDQAARADYEQVLQLRPSDARAQLALADLLYAQGEQEAALALYAEVIQQHPRLVYALVLYGNRLFELRDYPGAIVRYQQALAIDPQNRVATYNLGRAYELAGELKQALTIFQDIVDNPADYDADTIAYAQLRSDVLRVELMVNLYGAATPAIDPSATAPALIGPGPTAPGPAPTPRPALSPRPTLRPQPRPSPTLAIPSTPTPAPEGPADVPTIRPDEYPETSVEPPTIAP